MEEDAGEFTEKAIALRAQVSLASRIPRQSLPLRARRRGPSRKAQAGVRRGGVPGGGGRGRHRKMASCPEEVEELAEEQIVVTDEHMFVEGGASFLPCRSSHI